MSTYDKSSSGSEKTVTDANVSCDDTCEKKEKKLNRKVCFPHDDQLVTQYFEPANPWQDSKFSSAFGNISIIYS